MIIMTLGQKIKAARIEANMNQGEFSLLLKQHKPNIRAGDKTISSWETGKSSPDVDTLFIIVKMLNLEPDYFFDKKEKVAPDKIRGNLDIMLEQPLTPQEIEHIKKHRSLTFKSQVTVLDLIVHLYDIEHKEEHASQQNVFDLPYADDRTTIDLPMPFGKASAGDGNYVFGDAADTKTIVVDDTTRKADFIMEVSGVSMQPKFDSGDLVAVRYMPDIAIGEIGIFDLNGNRYIKQRGENGLISLNPDSDDLPVSDFDSARCLGKVIAKIDPKCVVG